MSKKFFSINFCILCLVFNTKVNFTKLLPALNTKRKSLVSKKKQLLKDKANEKILFFFSKAREVFPDDPALANRYVSLARKQAMRHKIRLPRELRRLFCRHCYRLLVPGKTVRIRTHRGKVVYFCLNCRKFMRFVY